MAGKPCIFVGIPTRGQIGVGTMTATHQAGNTPVHCLRMYSSSLLTLCFNNLWCAALNERKKAGLTHFVMLHDDVAPLEPGWLDTLLAEQQRVGADVLACVIPIKDDRGLTSTAFLNWKTSRIRRLTMTEACRLPETFDAAAAGYPGQSLLPNTGLWICDLTRPWVEKICFTIRDKVFQTKDGTWVTQCFSEDWDFGVQAAHLGLKVWATRKIKINHQGGFAYPNFVPWGNWQTDTELGDWSPPQDGGVIPEKFGNQQSQPTKMNRRQMEAVEA